MDSLMILETKTIYLCALAGTGAILSGEIVSAIDPSGLDPVEKYGVLGLLAVMCVGLLKLITKLSDAIASNATITTKLVASIDVLHEGQQQDRGARETAVDNIKESIERTRNDIIDALTRCQK
jgi:hypothetical protein